MIALGDVCAGAHVAMLQRDHVRLAWHSPSTPLERARSVAWTCSCRATIYELCMGGGRAFLRQTIQLDGRPQVRETPLMPISEARETWTALLSGRAR